jgi:hypothetical protein
VPGVHVGGVDEIAAGIDEVIDDAPAFLLVAQAWLRLREHHRAKARA